MLGFLPIYTLQIPDTLEISSIWFEGGVVYWGSLDGSVFANLHQVLRTEEPIISICKRSGKIYAGGIFKIYEANGGNSHTFRIPHLIKNISCSRGGVYILTSENILLSREGEAPRVITKGVFSDIFAFRDTLYILEDNLLKRFYNGKFEIVLNFEREFLKIWKVGQIYLLLDKENTLWAYFGGRMGRILKVDNLSVKGDTVVIYRDEDFGKYIYVFRVLRCGKI
jgi:hypothetical protein